MKSPYRGMSRIVHAFEYSWKGFVSTWRFEEAFRQEVLLILFLTPFAIWLADSYLEFVALFGVLLLVLIVELLNSAVESIVDRVGEEFHELSGRAKDQGSAAVLLAFVIAALVWGGIIFQKVSG